MKNLITSLALLTAFVSCGKMERPEQLFDFLDHDKLEKQVEDNTERINELEQWLNELDSSINNTNVNQDSLEDQITSINSRLVTLETNTTVSEIIDPCGDKANQYDEHLIKLSDGKIIAYFEQNGNRFLTILPDGSYRTTDNQACNFSIVNGQYQE